VKIAVSFDRQKKLRKNKLQIKYRQWFYLQSTIQENVKRWGEERKNKSRKTSHKNSNMSQSCVLWGEGGGGGGAPPPPSANGQVTNLLQGNPSTKFVVSLCSKFDLSP
jgi:hypothetical protein